MDDLKDKIAIVYDNGCYVPLAEKLAPSFKKLYYFLPIASAFPLSEFSRVGSGIANVERIYEFWDYVDKADIIIFPDTYDGDLQAYLRLKGKRVFGLGKAEWLELDRWKTREYQLKEDMPTLNAVKITGMDELKKYCEKKENLWIKVSQWRGDMETFHHVNMHCSEPFFNTLQHKLGAMANVIEFIVEDDMDGVEIGYDGFTMDGAFPEESLYGYEIKDMGYIGRVVPYEKIPPQIWFTNTGLSSVLRKESARGFFSTELRVDKNGTPFLIDPCLRAPSPPYELEIEIIENLAEVIWGIAGGEMVNPKYKAKYGACIVIHSDWATKHWMPIKIPKENRQYVKLKNLAIIDGKTYVVPLYEYVDMSEIGSVIGMGNTIEEAIKDAEKHAEGIEGHRIDIRKDSLQKAVETIEAGRKFGLAF